MGERRGSAELNKVDRQVTGDLAKLRVEWRDAAPGSRVYGWRQKRFRDMQWRGWASAGTKHDIGPNYVMAGGKGRGWRFGRLGLEESE